MKLLQFDCFFIVFCTYDSDGIVEKMQTHSRDAWERLLNYLLQFSVNSNQEEIVEVPERIYFLLVDSGILTESKVLTPRGYQFLLQNTPSQLWVIIEAYINITQE